MESNIDTTCPACGGVNVSTISCGYGAQGGCTRLDNSPNRQCHDCRHHWLDVNGPGYKEDQTTTFLFGTGSYLPANTWHWMSWTTRPPTYLWGTKVVEMDLSESPRSDAPITDLCGQNLEKVWKWTRWDGDGSPSETPTHRAGDPKSDSGGIVMDWVDD